MSLALSALSAPALKARSGQFELEDIRHLRVHGLSIAQLGAGTLLACTSLVTLDISNNEVGSSRMQIHTTCTCNHAFINSMW